MSSFLNKVTEAQKELNERVEFKINNGQELTDNEILAYDITKTNDSEMIGLMESFSKVLNGEEVPGFKIENFLATPQAKVLIPKTIIGAARRAQDPIYLCSKFFKKIKLKSGSAVMIPSFGVMRAFDIAEGAEIPEQSIDWQLASNSQINVGKVGVRIQYTDDVAKETELDIISALTSEAGRSLARHKEQKAFTEFKKRGFIVFDNMLAKLNPALYSQAATTGVDYDNQLNGTMSLEDYFDLCAACYNNGYTPTNTVMHPLASSAFVKNGLTGALTAVNEGQAKYDSPNKSLTFGAGAIQGKLPFGLTVDLSPFAPINKQARTFDITVVDQNNVGYLVVKEELKTEGFRDPARELNNLKLTVTI